MTIRGFDRSGFENALQRTLSPTTPIRSVEFLRGRDQILEDIRRALVQPGRHVFVHGDRGVGKTSLAQTAAFEHQSSDANPIFVGCDNSSTFYRVALNIAQTLLNIGPISGKSVSSRKVNVGWPGVVSVEMQRMIENGTVPEFKSINEAVSAIGFLASKHSSQPVVVVDEFERIRGAEERTLFADFIKQAGDQSVPIKLIFCGIGSALGDLLDSHHSCYRYLSSIHLSRLEFQPRLEIIKAASDALALTVEDTTRYRIATISDGFPHYVHLLTEKLLWQVFEDDNEIKVTLPHHYSAAVRAAVVDIEPHLKAMYEKATLKYKSDYATVLWAVADHHLLKRRSTDIFESYKRIARSMGEVALERERFNQRMNTLKRPAHGSILKANRQGWYEFREAVVRGYVRLQAEAAGAELGNEHPLDGRTPNVIADDGMRVYRSR